MFQSIQCHAIAYFVCMLANKGNKTTFIDYVLCEGHNRHTINISEWSSGTVPGNLYVFCYLVLISYRGGWDALKLHN